MCNQKLLNRDKRKRPMKIDNIKHLNDKDVVFSMKIKKNFFIDSRSGLNAIRLNDNINQGVVKCTIINLQIAN
jgi:hypothetical protein